MWLKKDIHLAPRARGFHVITRGIEQALPEIRTLSAGPLQVFIQHMSTSQTINEDAVPTVRQDSKSWFNRSVSENEANYRHTLEGSDDLPAHNKASLLGNSVLIPVGESELKLGTWQGLYLGEHRSGRRPASGADLAGEVKA